MKERSLHVSMAALAAGFALAGASCESRKEGLPPAPEFAAAQRAIWELVPKDAGGAVVLGSFGHTLERLRALRTVLSTGPMTKTYIDKGMEAAIAILGFDPLDDKAWSAAGVDPTGPIAIAIAPKKAELLFRAKDVQKARATFTGWYKAGGATEPFDCGDAGALQRCGTPDWKLAGSAADSLWPHVEQNLPADRRGMEILAYAPLDQGPLAEEMASGKSPFAGKLHAGYFATTLAPERLIVRLGMRAGSTAEGARYLKPREGASLLGLAAGGVTAGRITFSPDALWALAKKELGDDLQTGLGVVQAATSLDLEKDVIDNLTGEIVSASYRTDKRTGADGKRLSYADQVGSAFVLGTRDDERTRRVADRLGGLVGGAIGTFADVAKGMGVTLAYRNEAGDRPVHWFTVDLDAERAKLIGASHLDFWMTTISGGLASGLGPVALAEVRKRVGQKPAAFLARLPLPEERALFETSPFVFWGKIGEGYATKLRLNAATSALDGLAGPEASKAFTELIELGQLLFDAVAALEVGEDRAELFYQLSYL